MATTVSEKTKRMLDAVYPETFVVEREVVQPLFDLLMIQEFPVSIWYSWDATGSVATFSPHVDDKTIRHLSLHVRILVRKEIQKLFQPVVRTLPEPVIILRIADFFDYDDDTDLTEESYYIALSELQYAVRGQGVTISCSM